MTREKILDLVLIQIQNDLEGGDLACVIELLDPLSNARLLEYLPEELREQDHE